VSKDIRSRLDQTNNLLGQVINVLTAGFVNIGQGLFAILEVQKSALNLLDHNRKQNDTIICELTHANDLLCNIMNKLGQQVRLTESLVLSIDRIEGIQERVHSDEVGNYDREKALEKKIEVCCPPKLPPPEPCPKPCDVSPFKQRDPQGQDWKPLPPPQKIG
jgi:hypothetical protein